MKYIYITLFSILCTTSLFAQEEMDEPAAYAVSEEFNMWNLSIGDTSHVFANNSYIRSYPSLESKVLDSLSVGAELIILSEGYNNDKVKGFHAPWHEVSYIKDNERKRGFVWLGLLAVGSKKDGKGNRFLYGYDRYLKGGEGYGVDRYLCEIKLLANDNSLRATHTFVLESDGQSFSDSKLLPNMGLEGLNAIYRVGFLGEACGIPSIYFYVGWNGHEFVDMPGRQSVSDAGVFYYQEQLLFPSEHKKEKNTVYKLIETGEVLDSDADELQYDVTKREEKFIWDGKVFAQLLELR